jgi:hypothetical protein
MVNSILPCRYRLLRYVQLCFCSHFYDSVRLALFSGPPGNQNCS